MTRRKDANIQEPEQTGDKRREGKKNIPWKEDPEILQRLAEVAQLMVKGKRAFEIARETKVSIETARRDIARVRELWREDYQERIANVADAAVAQYSAVQEQAWKDMQKVSVKSNNRAAFMKIILQAQDRIDKVTGIPDPISGPGGGPIPLELIDTEAIRKKRWQSIKGNLKNITERKDNEPTTKK
jgi:hypothetical protein